MTPRSDRPSWLRRNAVPLIALVPALAATVLVGVVVPYRQYADDHRPPPRIAAGHDAHLGDATFRVTRAGEFHEDGHPGVTTPKGVELLAVLIRVTTPGKLADTCEVTLQRIGDPKVEWDPVDDPSRFDYELSDSTAHLCDLGAASGSRTLELTFLVPEGTYRHAALDVQTSTAAGSGHSAEQHEVLLDLPATPYSDRSG